MRMYTILKYLIFSENSSRLLVYHAAWETYSFWSFNRKHLYNTLLRSSLCAWCNLWCLSTVFRTSDLRKNSFSLLLCALILYNVDGRMLYSFINTLPLVPFSSREHISFFYLRVSTTLLCLSTEDIAIDCFCTFQKI